MVSCLSAAVAVSLVYGASPAREAEVARAPDSLVVFHAGSLAGVFSAVADSLRVGAPGLATRFERGGSVELALRALEPGQLPDVIGVADDALIPALLMPDAAAWYASFSGNAMVVAVSPLTHGQPLTGANWPDVLLLAGARAVRGDPALDPGGYRALMLFQLAQHQLARAGLADSLERAVAVLPPGSASAYERLRNGELDYLVTYRSSAMVAGLQWLDLPPTIDLSEEAHAADYERASVQIELPSGRTLTLPGRPIRYGVTIPRAARHQEAAQRFVALLLSPRGRVLLHDLGFSDGQGTAITGAAPSGLLPPAGP